MKKWLLILVFSLFGSAIFAQCPMCKASTEGSNYAKKINTGILYLLAFPFVMAGGFGTYWYLNRNKFHDEDQTPEDNDLLSNINLN